jgi:hypothetical protein
MSLNSTFIKHPVAAISFLLLVFLLPAHQLFAQLPIIDYDVPVVKETKTESRQKLYRSLVAGINRNLSLSLSDSTEENWMDAFYSIEMLRYKSPWIENKMREVFNGIEKRSDALQFALIECVYDAYPVIFETPVKKLLDNTGNSKVFAACSEYLLKGGSKYETDIAFKAWKLYAPDIDNAVIQMLLLRMGKLYSDKKFPPLPDFLHHSFFSKAKIVFSFQRKNRNYPGLAIVRDSAGNFIKDYNGNVFSVTQLARSITNLPGYFSNGNTPQGIFRMKGFDKSRSIFIGPTENIQLTMPFETSLQRFFNDSSITDSVWTTDWYLKLLPESWANYFPVKEAYYAGKAGRTEIISHGTTVDPSYYKGTPFYPLTPTLGCLCTKEIWDEETGKRKQSDQQKLVDALKKAGGADGYYIVIELNDEQRPVDINDVLPYLK